MYGLFNFEEIEGWMMQKLTKKQKVYYAIAGVEMRG